MIRVGALMNFHDCIPIAGICAGRAAPFARSLRTRTAGDQQQNQHQ